LARRTIAELVQRVRARGGNKPSPKEATNGANSFDFYHKTRRGRRAGAGRCPKFMRTLWVCNISGGPFQYTATKPGTTSLGLEEAHRNLRISPAEFDEVAAELGRTLDFFKVPKPEKGEVLAAFAAHKNEVTAGYTAAAKRG